jgi:squalene synthase HpnC
MTESAQLRSGKGSKDENFPVASLLISERHRPAILAFYEFVRVADDIADHADLSADEKIARLDRLEGSLLGQNDVEPQGVVLRDVLRERGLSPIHPQDVLRAFRQDATKLRYANWDELVGYCEYSANPVGRFVLDVHGEDRSIWPANDALCTALQITNHLQDCAADYRNLNRVYVPLDALALHGQSVEALAEPRANPALKECLQGLAARVVTLLDDSRPFSRLISDTRLAMEVSVIQLLAERLTAMLLLRDPLCERVHLSKFQMLMTAVAGVTVGLSRRMFLRGRPALSAVSQ